MLIEAEGQKSSADELHQRKDTPEGKRDMQTGECKDGGKGGGVASGGSCKGVGSGCGGDVVYRCKPTAARLCLCPFKTLLSSVNALLRRRELVTGASTAARRLRMLLPMFSTSAHTYLPHYGMSCFNVVIRWRRGATSRLGRIRTGVRGEG